MLWEFEVNFFSDNWESDSHKKWWHANLLKILCDIWMPEKLLWDIKW